MINQMVVEFLCIYYIQKCIGKFTIIKKNEIKQTRKLN